MGIQVDVLSTFRGHLPIYVQDTNDLAQRAKLAEQVARMMKDGYDLFLIGADRATHRIKEYDKETNEWIVFGTRMETPAEPAPTDKKVPSRRVQSRVSAEGTTTAAVARTAGG